MSPPRPGPRSETRLRGAENSPEQERPTCDHAENREDIARAGLGAILPNRRR